MVKLVTAKVLCQINVNAMKTLQSVLHSAARLVMRKRKVDSITPVTDTQR